jgi:hypothetical protein
MVYMPAFCFTLEKIREPCRQRRLFGGWLWRIAKDTKDTKSTKWR